MRFLLISIFFILLLTSCSLSTTKGLLEHAPNKEYIINNYFSNLEKDYIYKTKLQILKYHFGGILIIKKIGKDHHRVVFTTEFGNKLFDLELIDNNFEVNFILDKLNKKFILKMLQHDFQTLLHQNNTINNQFSGKEEDIFQSNRDKYQNYYVFLKRSNDLNKIISASKNKEKLTITFSGIERGVARSISLSHKKFNAAMELDYIGKKD